MNKIEEMLGYIETAIVRIKKLLKENAAEAMEDQCENRQKTYAQQIAELEAEVRLATLKNTLEFQKRQMTDTTDEYEATTKRKGWKCKK
jgi:cytochrome c-type biogenesis protein CcmH/NrfG